MKVSIENLASHLDPILVKADVHGWRSLLRHDVDLVGPVATGTELIIHALLKTV